MTNEAIERENCALNEGEHFALNGLCNDEVREYTIEEVFHDYVGEFGKYQKLLTLYLWIVAAPLASILTLSTIITLLIVPHSCKFDASNITLADETDISAYFLPKKVDSNDFESCFMYNRTVNNQMNVTFVNETEPDDKVIIKCNQGWNYDRSKLLESAASEHDWVCDDQWKALFPHAVTSVGAIFGSIFVGIISDAIGRVKTITIFAAIAGIAVVLTTFVSHHYPLFLACRILFGFTLAVCTIPNVLVAEFVGNEKRSMALIGFMLSYSTFNGLLPWIAHFIGNWRVFNLVASSLVFLVPICSLFTLESPRWLLSVGNRTKAARILTKVARINGKEIPDNVMVNLKIPDQRSARILSILKHKYLLCMFAVSSLIGFLYMMVFMTHNLFAANLSKHPFILLSLFVCVDVFGAFVARFSADYLGRQKSMICASFLSAIFYSSTVIIPKDFERVIIACGLIARIGVTVMTTVNNVHCSEIFPTVVRSRLILARTCITEFGTALGPLLTTYTFMGPNTPLFLSSVAIFATCLLSFLMPETLGKQLPETFEDADKLMRDHRSKNKSMEQVGRRVTKNSDI